MDGGALALALVAGAVAAFNPCGFALLPPYLALLVAGSPDAATSRGSSTFRAVGRALRFTTGMTVGFLAVFTVFGLLVAPLALSVERYLPFVTVVIGVALVLLGAWLLAGRSVAVPGRLGRGRAPRASWGSQVGYGVSFALASLSCTIGPFLAVTSTSLRGTSALQVVATYAVYALGMGIVVLVLALAAATAQETLLSRIRGARAFVGRVGGLVLVLAGAYVAWYGWFEIRVQGGGATDDVVVDTALRAQALLTRLVTDAGAGALVALGIAVAVLGVLMLRRGRPRPADAGRPRGPARSRRPGHPR